MMQMKVAAVKQAKKNGEGAERNFFYLNRFGKKTVSIKRK